jgi:hypothetical protein
MTLVLFYLPFNQQTLNASFREWACDPAPDIFQAGNG